ncbi:MAG: methyltransferase, partial [Nitriliruptorales bacterium]|nr:methyltransferase [Nitriliruptorales bacterium]
MRSANASIRSVERLQRALTLPLLRVLGQTVAMAEVQATTAFAALGIADHLENSPRTAEELAAAVGGDPDKVSRLLEFLATRGIVRRRNGQFALTASSDLLRRGHPDSVRDWVLFQGSAWQWGAWAHLAEGVSSGATPFELAHGRSYFDHLTADEAAGTQFDAAMRSTSRLQGQLLARALDLHGVGTLCDVGGGTGSVLAALLEDVPDLTGALFDLPAVCDRAPIVLEEAG